MLNIYIGKENLPKDKALINDADAAIMLVTVIGTDFQRLVLERVEHGVYKDQRVFTDRFGNNLYYTDMSTGAKALMLVDALHDKVINCAECGENALSMLSHLTAGNVYLPNRTIALPWEVDCPVQCYGRTWERISLLNGLIG